jgi:hypothetical protein
LIRIPSVSVLANRPLIEFVENELRRGSWNFRELPHHDARMETGARGTDGKIPGIVLRMVQDLQTSDPDLCYVLNVLREQLGFETAVDLAWFSVEAVAQLETYTTQMALNSPEFLSSDLVMARHLLDASRKDLLANINIKLRDFEEGDAKSTILLRVDALQRDANTSG